MDLTRYLMLRLQGAAIDTPIANGKGGAPSPASPLRQANAQAATTPDTYTPFGNIVYSGNPRAGTYRANVTLSPTEKALYKGRSDVAQAILGRTGKAIEGLPVGFEFNGAEDPTTNRFFMNQKKLLDRTFDQDAERLDQKLANQGLPMGGEAYTEEMDRFQRTRADAMESAAAESLGMGFNQDLATRQQNYNEIATALGAGQLQPVTGAGSSGDVSGAFAQQNAAQLAQHQGDVATGNTAMAGAATIAAAFI